MEYLVFMVIKRPVRICKTCDHINILPIQLLIYVPLPDIWKNGTARTQPSETSIKHKGTHKLQFIKGLYERNENV